MRERKTGKNSSLGNDQSGKFTIVQRVVLNLAGKTSEFHLGVSAHPHT